MEKISIVVAGHTNTGKTTLIRTLMKSSVGEVGDRANVTQKGHSYHYEGLQANFVDTPGFRYASVYNMYLEARRENINFQMPNGWQEKIELDLEAIKAIEACNIVLYVGSLAVVPDESHFEEIRLVKKLQPQIVGILNQKHIGEDVNKVVSRVKLWEEAFFENGIDNWVDFDAHWDKYSKANLIYDQVAEVITRKEQQIFNNGLAKFKKRQSEIREEACRLMSICVTQLQNIRHEYISSNYSESEEEEQIKASLHECVVGFIDEVNGLYKTASMYPTDSIESLKIKHDSKRNWGSRVGSGASYAAVLGGGSAAVGAAIGALVSGVFTVGLAAAPGAILGAQIGGTIGSSLGVFATLNSSNDKIIATLDEDKIKSVAQECTAVIWGLSMSGYGRSQELNMPEIDQIENDVKELYETSKLFNVEWKTVNEELVFNETFAILEKLEERVI